MVVPLKIRCIALLLLTVAVANWHLPSLGLYYDDWLFTSLWGTRPETFLIRLQAVLHEDQHGRPLGNLLLYLLFYLGRGLTGCYLLSLAIQAALAWLCWRWLERVGLSTPSALVGALFWAVNPADPAKFYLVRAFHVETALGLYLLGALAFLSQRPRWGYLAYAAGLLNYEIWVVPFMLLPLLQPPEHRRWRQHLARSGAILLLVVLAYRLPGHPGRLADAGALNGVELLTRSVSACFLGPLSQLVGAVEKTRMALQEGRSLSWLVALLLAAVVLVTLRPRKDAAPPSHLWLAGVLLWASSYVPMVTNDRYPPTHLLGQLTSTHCGGWPGQALLVALLWSRLARPGRTALALAFATALVFQHNQQQYYARSWTTCCRSWRQVLNLTSDAGPQDIILVQPPANLQRNAEVYPWCSSMIYPQLVNLSSLPGKSQPVVAVLAREGPQLKPGSTGWTLHQKQAWIPGHNRPLREQHLIVLQQGRQGFERRQGWWEYQGWRYRLRPPEQRPGYAPGLLYPTLGAEYYQ